jgi:hypothetical protein
LRLPLATTALIVCGAGPAHADSLRLCDRAVQASAPQQDQLLRFAAIVKTQLESSGDTVAIVSRSGLDLKRLGIRYSHAGVSLRASANAPWSVRQLYYACDEGRPRIYDQGMAGFVLGVDNPEASFISIVLIPRDAAAALERAALDNATALQLLAGTYSANAYPYTLKYQNCNQWLAELVATAWGAPENEQDRRAKEVDARDKREKTVDARDWRARAQQWLAAHRYAPAPVELRSHLLMFAAPFVPHVHLDDHPEEDRHALRMRVSLPAAIEKFVRERWPDARHIELCQVAGRVVVRHGWDPLGDRCTPQAGDSQITLSSSTDTPLALPSSS